jgi:hypothetical protein
VVVALNNFGSKVNRDYSATLDAAAFDTLLTQYAPLFEPAFAIWGALSQYCRPAAKVADKLAAAGHDEFSVTSDGDEVSKGMVSKLSEPPTKLTPRTLGQHGDNSNEQRRGVMAEGGRESRGDRKAGRGGGGGIGIGGGGGGKGGRGSSDGGRRGGEPRVGGPGNNTNDEDGGRDAAGNMLGALLFGDDFDQSRSKATKVRPHRENSVSEVGPHLRTLFNQ